MPSRLRNGSPTSAAVAERVQAILASKELTLYRVSQQSAALYGRSSPFFVPHNLYFDLRTGSFTPSIHQVLALSRISGYRLLDWLRVFGFHLEDIARMQVLLSSKRTIVLDTSLTDPNEWTTWVRNRSSSNMVPSIAPLAQLLEVTSPKRIRSLSGPGDKQFLYVKVGREDAFAFPDLLPGSIVRVNLDIQENLLLRPSSPLADRVFLIEHSKGFWCCRMRVVRENVIVPYGTHLSFAQVELQCPLEARVRGIVDFEILSLLTAKELEVPNDLSRHWKPEPLVAQAKLGQVLSSARIRMNLSLREAAAGSRMIRRILDDARYSMSPTSLCDYERLGTPPRDVHKIITLCSLYGLEFESFLKTIGITFEKARAEPMPDRYLPRLMPTKLRRDKTDDHSVDAGFLEQLLQRFEEIPFFLRNSLEWFSPSAKVSLGDFVWIGGEHEPLHPYLEKGLLAIINRRRKTAIHFVTKPWWQQPLYIILRRNGMYLAACCAVENDMLVIYPYTRDFRRSEQFRAHLDAEVVGQIVAIVRKVE